MLLDHECDVVDDGDYMPEIAGRVWPTPTPSGAAG